MKALLLSWASIVALPLLTQTSSNPPEPQPYAVPEAYEVYNAILPTGSKILVVRAETDSQFEMCLQPDKDSDPGIAPAIENWKEVNRKAWVLQAKFETAVPFVIVPAQHIDGLLENGGDEAFYGEYPDSGGFFQLSAVGFNKDKTVAVVYMGHWCGGLCGEGTFHVLAKHDGKWGRAHFSGTCFWIS